MPSNFVLSAGESKPASLDPAVGVTKGIVAFVPVLDVTVPSVADAVYPRLVTLVSTCVVSFHTAAPTEASAQTNSLSLLVFIHLDPTA
jgi:hypothetical protein